MGTLNPATTEEEPSTEAERLEQLRRNKELAIDDVRCQQDVGWFAPLRVAEAEYQQETVRRAPDLLTEARDLLEAYSSRLFTPS